MVTYYQIYLLNQFNVPVVFLSDHTRTVVQVVVMAMMQVSGKAQNSTHHHTPRTINQSSPKIGMRDYVMESTRHDF